MRKIIAFLMVLCLATAFIGCSSNTSINGKWYKHGNLRDNCLQISEDNTWKLYQPENDNLTLIAEGTVGKDDGQLGFKDTSNTTYYSDILKNEIKYIGVSYYRAEDSVDGFEAYNGKWYRGGDTNNNFLKIEDGEWEYWESDGTTSTSNLNGYLASDGKKELLAYDKHTDKKYCRIGLLTESELRFDGKKYSLK